MNFFKFFIASFFGRGARFFLVSLVLMFFGEAVKKYIELDIGKILKRKKEQLEPYIIKALNTKWGYF